MSSRCRRWLIASAVIAWIPLAPHEARAARIDVCGEVVGSMSWTAADVYVVNDCRLRVLPGVTLTIQPGTVVKFAGVRATLRVEGTLVAEGTAGSPISFTAYADDSRGGDTNGDGPSSGSPGSWGALRFAAGSEGSLEHVFLGFGGSGHFDHDGRYTQAVLESFSSAVSLDRATVRSSGVHGVWSSGSSPRVTRTQFVDNAQYGLVYDGVDPDVPLDLAENHFSGSGVHAGRILLGGPAQVTVRDSSGGGTRNGFRVDGTLAAGYLAWDNEDDLPLVVEGQLTIDTDAAVTLAPATVVKFGDARSVVRVRGAVFADGTEEKPVVLTSIRDDEHGDDTNGDGDSSGAPGQWGGVRFEAGSQGRLSHARLFYGASGQFDHVGRYNAAMLEAFGSEVTLEDCELRSGLRIGAYAENASLAVTSSVFADNGEHGLRFEGVDPLVPVSVLDSTFHGNGIQAGWLRVVDSGTAIELRGNRGTGPRNGFRVSGRLTSGGVTWDNGDELPLLIDGGLTVGAGVAMRLEAGSVVKFAGQRDVILVQGSLDAEGSVGAPVVLTAFADDAHGGDTNGDGPSTAAAGQWGGVRFAAGSRGMLRHVEAAYGGSGHFDHVGVYNSAIVESYTSDLTLDRVLLRNSGLHGLHARNASVAVTQSTIAGNAQHGLFFEGIDPLVALVVTDTVFSGPGTGAARVVVAGANPPAIVFARNTSSGGGIRAGFSLSGTVNTDATWENNDSLPLVVDGGVTVAEGATLSLSPGTVVKFAGVRDVIHVLGALVADGTAAAPIAFTSLTDDGHGGDTDGGGASTGVPAQWGGLRFTAEGAGFLRHVFVGWGGSGHFDYVGRYNAGLIESYGSNLSLDHVTLQGSGMNGLYTLDASVSVLDGSVHENARDGLFYDGVAGGVPLAVRRTVFSGNGYNGARLHLKQTAGEIELEENAAVGPRNAFRIDGRLAGGSLSWRGPEQAIVIDGGLAIAAGALLRLEPGTVMKFLGPRDSLQIEGALEGLGTFAAPLAFTSIADDSRGNDSNGDGPSAGASAQWGSLRVLGGRVDLSYAEVRYGGSGHFDHFARYGAGMVELRGGQTRMVRGTIAASGQPGIWAEAAEAVFTHNDISGHAGAAIQNSGPAIDARRNWWGAASGPKHPTLNPGGTGGTVSNGVRFDPWLDRYTWLEPVKPLLHGVEPLSWRAFGVEPTSLSVDAYAADGSSILLLGGSLPASAATAWDTRQAADGPYELRAVFREGGGRIAAEAVLPVVVNNDSSIEWHGGRVTGMEVWSATRLHVVESDVIVGAGAHLVIEPGAVVKFLPGTRLIVESGGTADALAAPEAPIVLTSIGDDTAGGDTNLDGDASRPRPGDWDGAQVDPGGEFNRSEFVDLRYSQATHSGVLAASETWLGSLVHRVVGDVVVPAGTTLTIEAGAIVKLDRHLGIVLQPGARLIAVGAAAEPVVITSIRDDAAGGDTNGDGDVSAAAPGDWRWIHVDGADAVLEHVELRYGGGTISGSWDQTGMLRTSGAATLAVRNSVLRDALFDGILAWGGPVTVENSILTNIDRAVAAHPDSPVQVIHCTLDGNRIGLLVHGGTLDVVNTTVSNSAESGIQFDFGTLSSVRYSNVWKPAGSTSVNYRNTPDRTGSTGNVSVDPRFVSRAQGNFRLDYLSPLIDAADGAASTPADHFGAPRYDDPRSPNTGTPAAGGAYADIGAWEFVESAPSPIDLVVTRVAGPSAAVAGETARVDWTVTNAGTADAVGPWHDTVNLVYRPQASAEVIFAAEVLVGQGKRLGPGRSLAVSAEVRVPGSVVGEHRWQVVANTRAEVFEGANRANNATLSVAPVALDLPELVPGAAPLSRVFDAAREPHWFKFVPEAGEDVLVRVERAGSGGVTELYVGAGTPPTRQRFDVRQQQSAAADVSALAAATAAQTYYVLVYPASLPPGSASFEIGAVVVPFGIESVGPAEVGNAGRVTFTIRGGKLHDGLLFEIVDAQGGVHAAAEVFAADSSLVYATFELAGLPVGAYRVRVSDGPQTVLAPATTTVVSGRAGRVRASLTMPEALRPDWTDVATIAYRNDGGGDVVAPLLFLSIANARLRLPGEAAFAGSTLQLLGIHHQGPAGILPPGASGSIAVELMPTGTGNLDGKLWIVDQRSQPIDWNALEAQMRPEFVPQDAWKAVFANFRTALGSTVGEMHAVLASDATHLSELGEYTPDVRRLLGLELNHAGVGLFTERYTLGAFGRGAPAWWEIHVRTLSDGLVAVVDSGRHRFFRPLAGGGLEGVGGETAILTRTATGYALRDDDDLVSVFDAAGRLSHLEDASGNRVTPGYEQGRVTRLTSSGGEVLTYRYGPHGRIVETTDSVGRTVTYAYDATGEHLARITDAAGTTELTYVTGSSPVFEHALESMSFADGTLLHFEYDSRGRLVRHHAGGGAEAMTFAYPRAGQIQASDSVGGVQSALLDADGAPGRLESGAGERIDIGYDARRLASVLRGPDGAVVRAEYDGRGLPTLIVDPLGNRTSATYDDGLLRSVTNARGATTRHEYDAARNRVRTIHPDGRGEQFAYDPRGHLVGWTNGRGRLASYEVDAVGLLVREDLADGTSRRYEYDARGNMEAIIDARGTTAFVHDGADQLTGVTDPSGRTLSFQYDAGGRRTRLEDQGGFALHYDYDSLGRLERVSGAGGGMLAAYEYDDAGRVAAKVLGNGVRTDYAYDEHGRIAAILHARAGGAVLSQTSYDYDALGRRRRARTDEGEWRYRYDGAGRLVEAVFAPTGGALEAVDLRYSYDAAGNRTAVVRDGTPVSYTANLADQLLTVGAHSLRHDEDGNLVERGAADGPWSYSYDDEGRLVRVEGPAGVWEYEYDFRGNRTAVIENGVRREYVVDPVSGQLLAVYDGAGALLHRYVHGFELSARIDAAGAVSYYTLDGSGSVSELLDAAGAVRNRYRYEPFGEEQSVVATVADPMRYLGGLGVMRDCNGLLFMRARYYDPRLGRFTQRDPLGGAQGPNLYEYAGNDPVNRSDPFGTFWGSGLYWAANQFMGPPIRPLTNGELWVRISNGYAYNKGRQDLLWREFHEWWRQGGSLRHGLKEFGRHTLNQARSGVRFASNAVRSGVGRLGNLVRGLRGIQIQITNVPPWIAKIPAVISSVGTTLGTSVSALGAGTVAIGVAVAGTVGVAIGTGLRYIPGVDSAAQSAWTKLDQWTGGWLFGTPPAAEAGTRIVSSFDPNDILGPAGFGAERWVSSDVLLGYTIRFENQEDASAPAQVVRVVQQLDPDLDFGSFELGSFGFGDLVVHVPAGRQAHAERIDLTATRGLFVDVLAEIDLESGIVVWEFRSIDPATGLAPRDPFAGFLPPNQTSPQGEGFVSYIVRARPSVAGGQWIDARARIYFDTNEPIDTPPHLNTLDAEDPWSAVEALPEITLSPSIPVYWIGGDGGAGVGVYDVWVSVDGLPFERWLAGVAATSAVYPGDYGHAYGFFSIARDHTGRVEPQKSAAEATTWTEPLPGDANCDSILSVADLLRLRQLIAAGVPDRCPADIDLDGEVDEGDVEALIQALFDQ